LSRVHISQESHLSPDQLRLYQARPYSLTTYYRCSPMKGGPMTLSTSTIQLRGHLSSRCHVTPRETRRSSHALVYIGVVVYILGVFEFTLYALSSFSLSRSHFSPSTVVHGAALVFLSIEEVQVDPGGTPRFQPKSHISWSGLQRKSQQGLGTEKPKVTKGERLEDKRTLVDLILGVLASRGGSSLSAMAITVEDGITESRPAIAPGNVNIVKLSRLELCLSALSRDLAGLSLPRSSRLSLCREQLDQCREAGQMENQNRTLKELATPDVVYQPWCIQYPQLEPAQTYELKSGLIHLFPKFHGLAGEDPHKHHKEFHVVCSMIRPSGIPEDYIKMKAFPFSLDGAAKDWLYLQPTLFNIWGDLKRTFLEKIFPTSRTATIRKEICGIRQHTRETLHEYWERFNKLYATCPHHQISEQLLIQYFYEGLSMMDRSMIDAASGGALMDKTPPAARHLISNMASNTQQFRIRGPNPSRSMNEIDAASNQRLEN
ncbi:hypothetical protein CR513_37246, partial [Mucuna pruriens]